MRTWKPLLLLFVCAMLCPRHAAAQGCVGVMTPEYSSYSTFSSDTGSDIAVSAVVDGYTEIHLSEYCQIPPGTTHQGRVYNVVNNVGGWSYGPTVSPSSYISLTNGQDIPADPGYVYDGDIEFLVYCTAVGDIFTQNPFDYKVELDTSSWTSQGQTSPPCYYTPNCKGTCTPPTRKISPIGSSCPMYEDCVDIAVTEMGTTVCEFSLCVADSKKRDNCT
ncbi:MAG: hypothetical protein ACRD5R_18025 [Candidatus Acidiferrales bacterium]